MSDVTNTSSSRRKGGGRPHHAQPSENAQRAVVRRVSARSPRPIDDLEADDTIGCIVLTGSEKAFAAGADIKEMQPKGFIDMFTSDFAAIGGDRVATCRKPTIAAVAATRSAAAANWR